MGLIKGKGRKRPVVRTYWRYYSRYLEKYDTLEEALRRIEYDSDEGLAHTEYLSFGNGKVWDNEKIFNVIFDKSWKEREKKWKKKQ